MMWLAVSKKVIEENNKNINIGTNVLIKIYFE
jgi:hypothetical protein